MKFSYIPGTPGRAVVKYESGPVVVEVGDKVECEVDDAALPAAQPSVIQKVNAKGDANVAGRDLNMSGKRGKPSASPGTGATLTITVPAGTRVSPRGNTTVRAGQSARGRVTLEL